MRILFVFALYLASEVVFEGRINEFVALGEKVERVQSRGTGWEKELTSPSILRNGKSRLGVNGRVWSCAVMILLMSFEHGLDLLSVSRETILGTVSLFVLFIIVNGCFI